MAKHCTGCLSNCISIYLIIISYSIPAQYGRVVDILDLTRNGERSHKDRKQISEIGLRTFDAGSCSYVAADSVTFSSKFCHVLYDNILPRRCQTW